MVRKSNVSVILIALVSLVFLFQNCGEPLRLKSQLLSSQENSEAIANPDSEKNPDDESHGIISEPTLDLSILRDQISQLDLFAGQLAKKSLQFELKLDVSSFELNSPVRRFVKWIDSNEDFVTREFSIENNSQIILDLDFDENVSFMDGFLLDFEVSSEVEDFPLNRLRVQIENLENDVKDLKHCTDSSIAAVLLHNKTLRITDSSQIEPTDLYSQLGQNTAQWTQIDTSIKEIQCASRTGITSPLVYSKVTTPLKQELVYYEGPTQITRIPNLDPFHGLQVGYSYSTALLEGSNSFYFGGQPDTPGLPTFGQVKYNHGIPNAIKIISSLTNTLMFYILDSNGTAHEFVGERDFENENNFTLTRSFTYSNPIKFLISGHLFVSFVLDNGSIYVKTLQPEFQEDAPFLALENNIKSRVAKGFHSRIAIVSDDSNVDSYRINAYGIREDGSFDTDIAPFGISDTGENSYPNKHLIEFGGGFFLFNQITKNLDRAIFE